jgi:nitrite reductase/ring-hydroxylating ferredoxin subunit
MIDYKALVQDDRIHASLYTDPRIFAEEMERIFHRGWVFVGHESEIPRPGDYVTRRIGTEPVVMVRSGESVSVLINRCRHRGTLVCPADRGHARALTCPYHGWTYDLQGALLGVPYPGGYEAFDKTANGLARAARVDRYRGFVFASLHEDGISLAEHLGSATRLMIRSGISPTSTTTGPASRRASSSCRPGCATARSRPRTCGASSPTSRRSPPATASWQWSRTSSWPSWPSRPGTSCTGGPAAPGTACAAWTAVSG